MRKRIAELAAFVDRARSLGRDVAGDAARERELPEQLSDAVFILGDARVELRVATFQIGVGDQTRAAVARADDVDRVEVARLDDPVHVGVDEVEARCRPPVAEKSRLDVPGLHRTAQERVVEHVDLPDAQVVGRSPIRVDQV